MNEPKRDSAPAEEGRLETPVRPRAAFEAWISSPPYEREVERFGENSAWPGNYRELDVDLVRLVGCDGNDPRALRADSGAHCQRAARKRQRHRTGPRVACCGATSWGLTLEESCTPQACQLVRNG